MTLKIMKYILYNKKKKNVESRVLCYYISNINVFITIEFGDDKKIN